METEWLQVAYLVSIALFVIGLKRLAAVRTARQGNGLMALGMLVAVVITLVEQGLIDYRWIALGVALGALAGVAIVLRAQATQMPEIVARFNGFGGAASALVALSLYWREVVETSPQASAVDELGGAAATTLVVSVLVGAATFSGSLVAGAKLRGRLSNVRGVPGRAIVMVLLGLGGLAVGGAGVLAEEALIGSLLVVGLALMSIVIGLVLVAPIGGADMPVVISLLNSLSGLAAAATGFALGNTLLIMAGTIVGAAGLMLTRIMCRAMNRSLLNVLVGGFGQEAEGGDAEEYESIVSADPEEAVMVLEGVQSVIIVPGYGLAVARAQHAAAELANVLASRGVDVRFAIHPVAGRMPGHMNVVLAEADVPYDRLYEMDAINRDFPNTDAVIVVGANDVVNPAANTQPGSPIAGMPILNVGQARRVFVIKRSLSPGYAGIKNELFDQDNTVMLFGDAKGVLDALIAELEESAKV